MQGQVRIDSNKLDTDLSAAGEPNVPLFPYSDPLVLGNTTLETTTEPKSILIRSGMRGKAVQLLLCPNSLYVRHDILWCTAPLGPVQGNSTLYLLLERLLSSRDSQCRSQNLRNHFPGGRACAPQTWQCLETSACWPSVNRGPYLARYLTGEQRVRRLSQF